MDFHQSSSYLVIFAVPPVETHLMKPPWPFRWKLDSIRRIGHGQLQPSAARCRLNQQQMLVSEWVKYLCGYPKSLRKPWFFQVVLRCFMMVYSQLESIGFLVVNRLQPHIGCPLWCRRHPPGSTRKGKMFLVELTWVLGISKEFFMNGIEWHISKVFTLYNALQCNFSWTNQCLKTGLLETSPASAACAMLCRIASRPKSLWTAAQSDTRISTSMVCWGEIHRMDASNKIICTTQPFLLDAQPLCTCMPFHARGTSMRCLWCAETNLAMTMKHWHLTRDVVKAFQKRCSDAWCGVGRGGVERHRLCGRRTGCTRATCRSACASANTGACNARSCAFIRLINVRRISSWGALALHGCSCQPRSKHAASLEWVVL